MLEILGFFLLVVLVFLCAALLHLYVMGFYHGFNIMAKDLKKVHHLPKNGAKHFTEHIVLRQGEGGQVLPQRFLIQTIDLDKNR